MSPRCLLALVAAATLAPALARAEEPAEEGYARIEARLCSEFEVCEPPCGTDAGDTEAHAAAER